MTFIMNRLILCLNISGTVKWFVYIKERIKRRVKCWYMFHNVHLFNLTITIYPLLIEIRLLDSRTDI